MHNWSRKYRWEPGEIFFPASEEEIIEIVRSASLRGKNIRTIGSGHSFTPLCVTNDILISLNNYQGLTDADPQTGLATVKAGTKLFLLGELLFQHGLALENMGDVDRQSIAGTISTGTHGTGLRFGTMATQVRALRFVNGLGEIVECSETLLPETFKAAQTGLGALGIITLITLQCVPAYKLRLKNKKEALCGVQENLRLLNQENRNFEFYWFPHTKTAWTKTANAINGEVGKMTALNYLSEYVMENFAFSALCRAGHRMPSLCKTISGISATFIPQVSKTFYSHKVYATKRLVKFNEMEYCIPLECHADAFKDVVKLFSKAKFAEHFPIENRAVKADDIWLSPACYRDSAYIACHAYYKKDPWPYFRKLEEIFRHYGGRPHWGKLHSLSGESFAAMYPRFQDFLTQRIKQDPMNLFLNDHLKKIFLP